MSEERINLERLLELERKDALGRRRSKLQSIFLGTVAVSGMALAGVGIFQRNSALEQMVMAEAAQLEAERERLRAERAELRVNEGPAASLIASGRYGDAHALLIDQLEEQERSLGPEHPAIIPVIEKLATIARASGHNDEVVDLYRRALEISERAYGYGHPITIGAMVNLAGASSDIGRLSEAESIYREAYEIAERSLGPGNPQLLVIRAGIERSVGAQEATENIIFLPGQKGASIAVSPDGMNIASIQSAGSTLSVMNILGRDGESVSPNIILNFGGTVTGAQFFPDGSKIAASTADGDIHVFDAASGSSALSFSAGNVRDFSISPDGLFIYALADGDTVIKIDATNGGEIFRFDPSK